jgi:transposase
MEMTSTAMVLQYPRKAEEKLRHGTAKPDISDELWAAIAPLIPARQRHSKAGRPPLDDRTILTGILFVLKSGIAWGMLPRELGCGAGMTCWRRLRDWQQSGAWQRLHRVLSERLDEADQIDWSRAAATALVSRRRPKGK